MNGKIPISVITNGDLSMKFTIEKEFSIAHHRLCAWHMIHNLTSNIGKPQFTSMFKKCILDNYEIDIFRQKWFEIVEKFGIKNKNWILHMYKKRHLWATVQIRGKIFAGVDHIRWKEVQADLAFVNGKPSMQTCFEHFKRSAANVYTLSIFHLFQPILV
ncbi:hypothetical protein Ahy_B10g104515 [Arachis hypogaea]|uniref:Uncharacterized protein n=1 Tax=Arachis hypogaea TaxID=3818 RepID=A0A444X5R0_ARAHY|nr:hypothetical protein Ahy_B10g104515 [Arachis hypogaea]